MASAQAIRLARLFTPTYARRINAQIVYPAQAQVVRPNELESALARPMIVARYEPDQPVEYLSRCHSFLRTHQRTSILDGNKRTAFFLANQYLCAHGIPGILDGCEDDRSLFDVADWHDNAAAGRLDVQGLVGESPAVKHALDVESETF